MILQVTILISSIQRSVYTIFIQQLCQWVMYGKFIDEYGEFFIQHVELNRSSEKRPPFSAQTSISTFQSSEPSVNLDLWRYEINYDILPHYFPKSWAEKVLFIGQTVLMFNSDPRESSKNFTSEAEFLEESKKHSVWGDQEQSCFRKFHELQEVDKLTVLTFEQIIDDIKICVTEHLSAIAITEADLSKQLRLIKDFYLLGRGELFYEFIKVLKPISTIVINENTIRDVNRVFQVAANSVNIHDEVELFSFEMGQQEENDSYNFETRGLFDVLILRYKIKWPLHLLFSPTVLEKYNELFRFLIRIKKMQHDLHVVWGNHREAKVERSSELLQFRNKLMFLIDNLQYYLQVDVLESQFSIMMGKIEGTRDFELIQRAHSCFQANILGLCFLLDIVSFLEVSSDSEVLQILMFL
jgi:gamma-tubulin complex component 4